MGLNAGGGRRAKRWVKSGRIDRRLRYRQLRQSATGTARGKLRPGRTAKESFN